jgi:acetyl esterase/lipase
MQAEEKEAGMNPIFDKYVGAVWLERDEAGPSEAAKQRQLEVAEEQSAFPMAPGNELSYLDDSVPAGFVRGAITTPNGLNLYHYSKEADTVDGDDRIIYYIHGGYFMRGNEWYCRMCAGVLAKFFGLPVYACEYRYMPEHKYPAGLDDVTWGWNYLVDELGLDPAKIIVVGESAGGTFAMALGVRLKREGRALPGGNVIMSGFLDVSCETPSYKYNLGVDPTFVAPLAPSTMELYLADASQAQDPEVSPVYADLTGFPPTFFHADDTEVFVSDSLICAEKLHAAGIRVKVFLSHGLNHIYPLEMPELAESHEVYEKVREFFGIARPTP